MVFIDAHCHLDHSLFESDVEKVIQTTYENNTLCISHGTGIESNQKTLKLANKQTVFAACGQDPFHAEENLEKHIALLEKNKTQLVAVGEIGLDQHYFTRDVLERQIEVFRAQLSFAEKNKLPVVIHTRKAVSEVLEILPSFACTKVLHYFLEKKFAQKALDAECYLSLPTIKSKDRLAIIRTAPLDRLLCETDAPFSWHGRNEPKNVIEVYETITNELRRPMNEIKNQIYKNANNVFKINR